MPLQQTTGNVTQDAYGGGTAVTPVYIEDVMSTFLYTGNGSATYNNQLIQNGLNLQADEGAGKDFLIWTKARSAAENNRLYSPVAYKGLISNSTAASVTPSGWINSASNGYYLSTNASSFNLNTNAVTYASWTFRKQPKFFDVVTYTGNGANRTIAHALGSVPGCIMVKRTDTTGNWQVYHNSLTSAAYGIQLNLTNAQASDTTLWNSTAPTTSVFSVGTNADVNASGGTYVAYLFAHNAGGFGLTGTDNVISCGSFTTDGSGNATVSLGYEPQWCMFKRAVGGTGNWIILDNMRGWVVGGNDNQLQANSSGAETFASNLSDPNATGFSVAGISVSSTYIYIAIRRGPMKVPTSGATVFAPVTRTGTGSAATFTGAGFPVDFIGSGNRNTANGSTFFTRLQGAGKLLWPYGTNAEVTDNTSLTGFDSMTGFSVGADGSNAAINYPSNTYVYWNFRRAPGFFDEVCYTGTSSTQNITHNLGAVPELMIIKDRTAAQGWPVYNSTQGNTKILLLNSSGNGFTSSTYWNSTTPTSSVFTVGTNALTNSSGSNFVAYLFATCTGVSKVGSYTGNGSTQTINCGFTGGARFVLIKRTDSTGNWYVYDTARGMTTLTDPYLLLNSTAAESATLGSVTTVTTGFAVDASILAAVNTNAATYIFLAVA